MIGRLIRFLAILAILGFLALVGYAYSGFMTPPMTEQSEPVPLDGD